MSANELMLQAADALEKMAAYIEATETTRATQEYTARKKQASLLADKIANTVGEPLDDVLVDKLAASNPEIQELIGRLTGGDVVDSLGGPTEVSKVASASGASASEDARFLDWVNS